MSMRLVPLAVLLTAALVGVTGCQTTIDTDSTEELISDFAEREFGAEPSDVSCPSDTEYEEGKTFECTAEYPDGTSQQVTVRMTGDDKVEITRQSFRDQ